VILRRSLFLLDTNVVTLICKFLKDRDQTSGASKVSQADDAHRTRFDSQILTPPVPTLWQLVHRLPFGKLPRMSCTYSGFTRKFNTCLAFSSHIFTTVLYPTTFRETVYCLPAPLSEVLQGIPRCLELSTELDSKQFLLLLSVVFE
jgi:hypothetical protein